MKRFFNILVLVLLTLGSLGSIFVYATPNTPLSWTISGTVYGGGTPLPNATVRLIDANTSTQVGTTTTNSNGFYSFTVNDDTYNMTIVPPSGSGFSQSVVNGITVSGANITQNVVLLQQAATISGVVKSASGVLLDNVEVSLRDAISGIQIEDTYYTTTNGQYNFNVAPGIYRFDVRSNGSTTLNTPNYWHISHFMPTITVTGNITHNLIIPFVTLSGKTTDSNGVAVGGVELEIDENWRIYDHDRGDHHYYTVRYNNGQVTSDSSGNYTLNLLPYTYTVSVLPPVNSGLAQTIFNNVVVTTTTTKDFAANVGVTISGVVKSTSGVLLDNIEVSLHNAASGLQLGDSYYTTANGQYSFNVAPGIYKFDVSSSGSTTLNTPNYWHIKPFIPTLTVTGNITQDLIIPFVTLSGKTTDSNGVAVGGVELEIDEYWYVYNHDIAEYHYYIVRYNNGQTVSDPSGNYTLNLLPYTYTVSVLPPVNNGLAQTIFNNVVVTTTTTKDFAANAGVTISGVVKSTSGVLLDNVEVRLHDAISGLQLGDPYYTTTNGQYGFNVAPGTYRFAVSSSGSTTLNTPNYWSVSHFIPTLTVTGNITQDLIIPFVTLSGKTTDSNGVAVGGVELEIDENWHFYQYNLGYYHYYSVHYNKASDSSGNYTLNLLPYTYTVSILPPNQSGFAQTIINNIVVTTGVLQNAILDIPDTDPPVIISGPVVTNITNNNAVVQWQTSEPAQGGVKYGTSDPPDTTLNENGYVTSHSEILTGLSADTTYFVSVFGSDSAGNATTPSAMITFHTQVTPDIASPVIIEGPIITAITHNSAIVTWQTNEPTTGVVSYGLTTTFTQIITDNTLSTLHSVTLSGLSSETLYYLQVKATDEAGNGPTPSATINFRTVNMPDTTAPIIVEGPMAINVTDTSATIIWRTDEPSTSGVSFNDGTVYHIYSDNNLTTFHSIQLTGLTSNTAYTYVVSSKDTFGNGPTLSSDKTFTTLTTPDTAPPVLVQMPSSVNVTHKSAVIRWETDEPTDGVIEFGTTPDFGSTEARTSLSTKHNIPLTGLEPGTLYYFRILSNDAAGNETVSDTYTFTTDSQSNNQVPTITSGPNVVYTTDNRVVAQFETDVLCDTVVEYGQGDTITHRQSNGEKVYIHQITLTNLEPNTDYSMTVSCTDMFGNTVVSPPNTLTSHPVSKFTKSTATSATGFTTGTQPDTTPPIITTNPVVTQINNTQAMITWTTNEIADSQISYHISGQPLNYTVGDIVQDFNHSIILTNLTLSTDYQFTVTSFDPVGNQVISAIFILRLNPTSDKYYIFLPVIIK